MSTISTYAELQTAVETWLNRSDLPNEMIRDLIFAGEIRLYDDVKLRAMEAAMSTTLTAGDHDIDYPSTAIGFKDAVYIIDNDTRYPVIQTSEEWLKSTFTDTATTNTGRPDYFFVTAAGKLEFEKYADADYLVVGTYYQRLILTDSDTTNWVLTNYPMALLYATLLEAQVMIEDDPRRYEAMYEEQLRRLFRRDNKERFGAGKKTFKQVSMNTDTGHMGITDTSCSKRW